MKSHEKFTAVYDEYADAIFRHCFLRVYDRELAKDIMQETFMKAWKYMATGNKVDNVRALLYKIATNLIIDQSRRPGYKKTDSLEDLLEAGIEPGEHMHHSSEEKRLQDELDAKDAMKILKHSKDSYREVLLLRYIDDLTVKQIAKMLGISENLVSVRLNRALSDLRKKHAHSASKKTL